MYLLDSYYLTFMFQNAYHDVTVVCEGNFYPLHKFVLATCSEYFEKMFENVKCKHPIIVLKGIMPVELDSLLTYMYVGEVSVAPEKLQGLVEAAEYLRIKGLALLDESMKARLLEEQKKRELMHEENQNVIYRSQNKGENNFNSSAMVNMSKAHVESKATGRVQPQDTSMVNSENGNIFMSSSGMENRPGRVSLMYTTIFFS